jgi:hypothetical protein
VQHGELDAGDPRFLLAVGRHDLERFGGQGGDLAPDESAASDDEEGLRVLCPQRPWGH